MRCKTCGEDIDFRMRKAMADNLCPYCGGEILKKEVMQQFLDLHSVLDPQRFTDNQDYDKRIKDKVIRILMEHMECVKVKEIKQDEDIVKLDSKEERVEVKGKTISSTQAKAVEEQKKMRKNMYTEVYQEQYGSLPPESAEGDVSEEDKEAAKDVVFSNATDSEKVERLKAAAKISVKNKPITRIQ